MVHLDDEDTKLNISLKVALRAYFLLLKTKKLHCNESFEFNAATAKSLSSQTFTTYPVFSQLMCLFNSPSEQLSVITFISENIPKPHHI